MTRQQLLQRADYYAGLSINFNRNRARQSSAFYHEVAERYRALAAGVRA